VWLKWQNACLPSSNPSTTEKETIDPNPNKTITTKTEERGRGKEIIMSKDFPNLLKHIKP
jgi:hypothetical protein